MNSKPSQRQSINLICAFNDKSCSAISSLNGKLNRSEDTLIFNYNLHKTDPRLVQVISTTTKTTTTTSSTTTAATTTTTTTTAAATTTTTTTSTNTEIYSVFTFYNVNIYVFLYIRKNLEPPNSG